MHGITPKTGRLRFTDILRTAVYETRTYGGVRGSPRGFMPLGSLLD